jgi:hypothetical protein
MDMTNVDGSPPNIGYYNFGCRFLRCVLLIYVMPYYPYYYLKTITEIV